MIEILGMGQHILEQLKGQLDYIQQIGFKIQMETVNNLIQDFGHGM